MPFRKGQSGNPSGRPKRVAALEEKLWAAEKDHLLEVVAHLRHLALAENDTNAARIYLDRVMGAARPAPADEGEGAEVATVRVVVDIESAFVEPPKGEPDA